MMGRDQTKELRDYLQILGFNALTDWLMSKIRYNKRSPDLQRLAATLEQCGSTATEDFVNAIHSMLKHSPAAPPPDEARDVHRVIDCIEELVEHAPSEKAIELAEQLHGILVRVGNLPRVREQTLQERLEALHLRACNLSRPDPLALADRLLSLELGARHEGFQGAAALYADVLGEEGLAQYRSLAEYEWSKVLQVLPDSAKRQISPRRRKLTGIMETLARTSNDSAQLAAVKSRTLLYPHCYQRVAELYKQAGMDRLCLEWAERGLAAFAEGEAQQLDIYHAPEYERLRDFLANEYERLGRRRDAFALVWDMFCSDSSLDGYKRLRRLCSGLEPWPPWREKAIAQIRAHYRGIDQTSRRKNIGPKYPFHYLANWRSSLVEVFLLEDDPDGAWRQATERGCRIQLWERLADIHAKTRPEEVISHFRKIVMCVLARKDATWYVHAAILVRKIGDCMRLQGEAARFATYVESLRTEHKRMRSFIACLDRVFRNTGG